MPNSKQFFFLRVLVFLFGVGFIIRLFIVQVSSAPKYRARACKQQLVNIKLLGNRGKIFDRHGMPLAFNKRGFNVRILSQFLPHNKMDRALRILSKFQIPVSRDETPIDYSLGMALKDSLRRAGISSGILVEECKHRLYPHNELFRGLLGFVGEDGNGLSGIEYYFDSLLKGIDGFQFMQREEGTGRLLAHPDYLKKDPADGGDIFLTIDYDLQRITYEELKATVDETFAKRGSAIILAPKTGEILALCDYDPKPRICYTPSGIGDEFEPGSVFKLVILTQALEEFSYKYLRNLEFDVSQDILISGKKIKDAVRSAQPNLSFEEAFIASSNIAVSRLSQMLRVKENFFVIARKFGFGYKTGIELSGEGAGILDRPEKLTPLRLANNSFGQGLRTTLLQLACAYCAIANDGVLLKPFIVKEIRNSKFVPAVCGTRKIVRRVMSLGVCQRVKEILAKVVTEGTGREAQIHDLAICGKTGTAQKLEPDGRYSKTKSIMTFIGFFPKEKPEYLIAVLVDEPCYKRGFRFASQVTCPLFKRIAEKIILMKNSRCSVNREPWTEQKTGDGRRITEDGGRILASN